MDKIRRRKGRPRNVEETSDQGRIQSVDRALDVIEALAAADGVTLTELAGRMGQPIPTIYRMLSTLETRQYVELDGDRQQWHVGPQAFRIGVSFLRKGDVIEQSRSVMRNLMLETGETSNLGIERSGKVLFVSQVETQKSIRACFPPGTLSPLHASGVGKALLSSYDDTRLEKFLRTTSLDPFTETTIISRDRLIDDLRASRDRGYAFDDEERTDGMRCLAACIKDIYGEVIAGISVSGPTNRLPDNKIDDIGEMVRLAAVTISNKFGSH